MERANNSNYSDFCERVKKVVCRVFQVPVEKVTLETEYIEDFEADSLDILSLYTELQDEFNVEMPEDNPPRLLNVEQTVEYMHALVCCNEVK